MKPSAKTPVPQLIGTDWIEGAERMAVLDKYTGETFATVTCADQAQVDQAVAAARKTFETENIEPHRRYEILMAAAEGLARRRQEFVDTMVAETGFTPGDVTGDLNRCPQTLRISAEEAERVTGHMVPFHGAPGQADRLAFTVRLPVGVVCAITPFNSPLNTVCHKVAPAFAAGNTMVLKPSAHTPVTAVKLAELLLDAGLPPGWLNVINGDGDSVGRWLLEHPDVDYYTFTGSTAVGRVIQKHAGLRRTQLELGNISATILCADADLERAVAQCTAASFRKAGQVCTSVQRLYVHRSVFDVFLDRFAGAASKLVLGDPRAEGTDIGRMISEAAAEQAARWIGEALEAGARVVLGGTREGALLAPTILTGTTPAMKVVNSEIFAPLVSVTPFDRLDEAIALVNGTPYGLAAGVFTNDLNAALKAARGIQVGTFHVNQTSSSRADLMPSGGVKDSGFGQEGPRYAIRDMTEERLITMTPTEV